MLERDIEKRERKKEKRILTRARDREMLTIKKEKVTKERKGVKRERGKERKLRRERERIE